SIPAGVDPGLRLYWATSSDWQDGVPDLSSDLGSASLLPRGGKLKDGPITVSFAPDRVPTPTPREIVDFRGTIDDLLAVVDMSLITVETDDGEVVAAQDIAESDENDNVGSLTLPRVSLELFDAPGADTPKERVGLWLQKHADEIKAGAKHWQIDA